MIGRVNSASVGEHFTDCLSKQNLVYPFFREETINIKEVLHTAIGFSTVNHSLEFLRDNRFQRVRYDIDSRQALNQKR